MVSLDYHWMDNRDWWHWEDWKPVLNSDAPEEAVDSYRHYKQQLLDIEKRTGRCFICFHDTVDWDKFDDAEIDEDSDFSNEYFTYTIIPYKEYLCLKEIGATKIIREGPAITDLSELFSLIEGNKSSLPISYKAIQEAVHYNCGLFYREDHII